MIADRSSRTIATAVIGGWTVAAFLYASHLHLYHELHEGAGPWRDDLIEALLACWLWAALTFVVIKAARSFDFAPGRRLVSLGIHLLLSAVLAFAQVGARAYLHDFVVDHHSDFRGLFMGLFARTIYFNVGIYWATVVVAGMLRRDAGRRRAAAELETRLAEARLDALRSQIQPHFLFNTLHTVSALIRDDAAAAEQVVLDLSELLRIVLDRSSAPLVTLEDELHLVGKYLDIQQVRFCDRLSVVWNVDPMVRKAAVPSLLLQPLVENSIRHGIESRPGEGRIEITAARRGHDLLLRVRDDGAGVGPVLVEGIGLRNTRERLEQLYAGSHRMTVQPTGAGTEVEISLPYRERE